MMPPQPNAGRARVYLSFADEDRVRAMELVRWLNDGGWQVAADERHAFVSGTWAPSPRLDACDVVLCVITPGWLVSTFCHHEFSHCAKRGKFVLPVICELSDVGLLPAAVRALPRVDLTRNRMIDYLTLREVLTQAGSRIAGAAPVEDGAARARVAARALAKRRLLWLSLAALLVASVAAIWLWARV
jgi:hypothetical protein